MKIESLFLEGDDDLGEVDKEETPEETPMGPGEGEEEAGGMGTEPETEETEGPKEENW